MSEFNCQQAPDLRYSCGRDLAPPAWEAGPIARPFLIAVLVLALAACAAETPGLYRADGSAAYLGPKAAVVLESREAEVTDPTANQDHSGAAYGGLVLSAVAADAFSDDGAIIAVAALAGMGVGWMVGELSEETLPGHVYVVKDKSSGDVFTVVQPTRADDWLLPPGTDVLVVGESRAARVVPVTKEPALWEEPTPDAVQPSEAWHEPALRWQEPGAAPL